MQLEQCHTKYAVRVARLTSREGLFPGQERTCQAAQLQGNKLRDFSNTVNASFRRDLSCSHRPTFMNIDLP